MRSCQCYMRYCNRRHPNMYAVRREAKAGYTVIVPVYKHTWHVVIQPIQQQLANRLPAACYVQHAASSSGSPPNVSHSLVYSVPRPPPRSGNETRPTRTPYISQQIFHRLYQVCTHRPYHRLIQRFSVAHLIQVVQNRYDTVVCTSL